MRSKGIAIPLVTSALNYNERKIGKGEAERIFAGNFLQEAPTLSKSEIKIRLQDRMDLNYRIEKKATHLILSFPPADQLNNELLTRIARDFMDRIGFGKQPYLVYRHFDTFTPHLHVLTTNIRPDGSAIHRRYFGGKQLAPIYRAIEEKFGLIRDEKAGKTIGPQTPGRALHYGEKPTTHALAEAIQYVRQNYQFRSLPELNAILSQYNVVAKRGNPGSRIHQNGGLIYQMLDDEGKFRGIPIRASYLHNKPILKALTEDFKRSQPPGPQVQDRVRSELDAAIRSGARFQDSLRRGQLALAPDVDDWGVVTGLLIVDLAARQVVKGEELGETYGWRALKQRLGHDPLHRKIDRDRGIDQRKSIETNEPRRTRGRRI